MAIIYFDMDGVLADFNGSIQRTVYKNEKPVERLEKGFYLNLKPISGTILLVVALINAGNEVYIASKPTSNSYYCASEKYQWVRNHIPELSKRVILTGHKELLVGDYLIDDHPERWSKFGGTVIPFNPKNLEESYGRLIKIFSENDIL